VPSPPEGKPAARRVQEIWWRMSSAPRSGRPAQPPEAVPTDAPLSQVKFLTVAEVAALMRVSKMTVYRLVHSGELTAVRVGRSFRVPERAVHDYLRDAFIEAG
jgi:excisionase family DNA binding protein